MSGRQMKKEGYLLARLIEQSNPSRLWAVATRSQRHGFESWKEAYVTLR